MSLYDDALAAGRQITGPAAFGPEPAEQALQNWSYDDLASFAQPGLAPEYVRSLLEKWDSADIRDRTWIDGFGVSGGTQSSGLMDGPETTTSPRTISRRLNDGSDYYDTWNEDGTYAGRTRDGSSWVTAREGGKQAAAAAALVFGVPALQGMGGGAAGATGGMTAAEMAAMDAAMIDMGAGVGGSLAGGTTAATTTAATAAGTAGLTEGGLQTIEIVGSKLPAAVGPGVTAAEVAAPIGAELTMEQLGNVETLPQETVDPTNYSNEGRNYPTTESTQGSGGSPVNSTSQFPGTPITDVNGNPVTQPTYDSNGNQIIPPINGTNGTPGTQLPGNQLPGGTNPLGTNDFKNLFDVLSGLYGLKLANDAVEKSDPFGPYREGYAKKLQALEANPGTLRNTPGFFTGQDMINRSMASKGYLGSGNQAAALQRFGGDFYRQEADRLAGLAGANINPGNTYFNAANLANQSLQGIGYGIAPYFQGGPR